MQTFLFEKIFLHQLKNKRIRDPSVQIHDIQCCRAIAFIILRIGFQDIDSAKSIVTILMQPSPNLLHNRCEFLLQTVLRNIGNCKFNLYFCRVDNLFCYSQKDAFVLSSNKKSKISIVYRVLNYLAQYQSC